MNTLFLCIVIFLIILNFVIFKLVLVAVVIAFVGNEAELFG